LVGAGPGDPRLITLRGLQCIERADVVVYDRLANPRLLKRMKPGAEKIYVGKLPDRHTMKQEEINRLLVELALQGKTVTRLKGGDPSVFGRVGEEAEQLVQHGIDFEIVPGVTSATAVPMYAGIPVTHRDLASSFLVVTGHENPEKLDKTIRWEQVTNASGTLIFLMGVAKIGYIAQQLMQHGKPGETPVALIRWGTHIEQETLVGTLETIARQVEEARFQPPAVIVVGDVVRKREQLQWFENMPLFGKRVLVTRAREQASSLAAAIEELGGEPFEFPAIRIQPPSGADRLAKLDEALSRLAEYDWIVFTSVNGVDYFFRRLAQLRIDIRRLAGARLAAVGPKTAEALGSRGLIADLVPPSRFQAEGLADALLAEFAPASKVLIPRGDLAREVLPDALRERGHEVTAVDVYETVPAREDADELIEFLQHRRIHAAAFTSSSTVTYFLEALKQAGAADPVRLLDMVQIVCIGPVTADTARAAGLTVHRVAKEATVDSLIEALREQVGSS
jgi:uroporphyrinogen III methyltransferase/synthase